MKRESIQITPVTEIALDGDSAKTLDPLLVSLKAVDPAFYPFYGDVELGPLGSLKDALNGERGCGATIFLYVFISTWAIVLQWATAVFASLRW